jgi:hypothetical protein
MSNRYPGMNSRTTQIQSNELDEKNIHFSGLKESSPEIHFRARNPGILIIS